MPLGQTCEHEELEGGARRQRLMLEVGGGASHRAIGKIAKHFNFIVWAHGGDLGSYRKFGASPPGAPKNIYIYM